MKKFLFPFLFISALAFGAIESGDLSVKGIISGNGSGITGITAPHGGTGVSNAGTLTWGSNNLSFTTSGSTSLTLPTSGTLGRLSGDTYTTTTLTSPAINGANFNFGTASNTNRLLLPSDTTTNLAGYTNTAGLFAYDSTQLKPVYNDGTGWSVVGSGSGSGGGLNWILNPIAASTTTGWTLYGVAGQNPPVDGSTTVGSVHITWTRDTSSPLSVDSLANFLYTKDAVNRQGEGAAYDFTVDRSYSVSPGMHFIKFDYEAASGTFAPGSSSAEGDLTLWVYDKTNAVLIQPFVYRIPSQNGHYITWFQNNFGSSSYRLIVHTASTSASAFTMRFNRMKIEPVPATNPLAPPPDVVAAFSLSTTTSLATSTIVQIGWDTTQVDTLGGGLTSNAYTVKSTGYYRIYGGLSLSATAGTGEFLALLYIDGTAVSTTGGSKSGTVSVPTNISYNFPSRFLKAGQTITVRAEQTTSGTVTVRGDSSASGLTTMIIERFGGGSTGSGTSPPVVMRASGSSTTVGTTQTAIIFPTTTYDSAGGYNSSTGVYTVKYPGKYHVCTYLQSSNLAIASSGAFVSYIYKNGSQYNQMSADNNKGTATSASTFWTAHGVCDDVDTKAGDTLQIEASIPTSTALNSGVGYFSLFLIGNSSPADPATFTGSRYYNATATLTGSFSDVTFSTKDYDTDGQYSGATWTCKKPGTYDFSGSLFFSAASVTAGQTAGIILMKNGATTLQPAVQYVYYGTSVVAATVPFNFNGQTCVTGDTFKIQALSQATTPAISSNNNNNTFAVKRVGN